MQKNTPPRSTVRLTRRGRIVLGATAAVVVGTVVAVPLLILGHEKEDGRPATLVIPEGRRASQVYAAVDKALALPAGSTRRSLAKAALKLPGDAKGNPEGYLFPAAYPVPENTTPEKLLALMVDTANEKFNQAPIAAGAQRNAMNVYQAVTIASIVQAEAATTADMGKVARVVFNRLERGMPLQMGSTVTYALGRSGSRTTAGETRVDSPYNTYQRMGLPPTPIANPGEEAVRAAINPPPGDWLYFVTVRPGETRFTADHAEHQRNVAEFHARHKKSHPMKSRPTAGRPMTGRPTTSQPTAGRPTAGRPTTGQPTTSQPMTGRPMTDQLTMG